MIARAQPATICTPRGVHADESRAGSEEERLVYAFFRTSESPGATSVGG